MKTKNGKCYKNGMIESLTKKKKKKFEKDKK